MHFDQLVVVLLGGLRDAFSRGPPSAEGGHKRAVLAAQCDYVRVRLVYVVVELGGIFSSTLSPLRACNGASLRRCIIRGACYLAVNWER